MKSAWLAALLLIAAPPAAAVSDLDSLLGGLTADGGRKGGIVVRQEVTNDGEYGRLRITLLPEGDARLVADPGSSLEVRGEGVEWIDGTRAEAIRPDRDYFDGPVTLELPFRRRGEGGRIEGRIEYLWCFVGTQCFFGEKAIRIELGAHRGEG